jgi:hypothetical protein
MICATCIQRPQHINLGIVKINWDIAIHHVMTHSQGTHRSKRWEHNERPKYYPFNRTLEHPWTKDILNCELCSLILTVISHGED